MALTFDDGPSEPYTSQVLDTLSRRGVKATFFVCGRNVEFYPQTAQRIVREGHLLGNHTYSHSKLLTLLGLAAGETLRTGKIINRVTGMRPVFFRPPYGMPNPLFWRYLKGRGYQTVLWNVDAHDWQSPPAPMLAGRILSGVKPGAVILLHDGHNIIHGDDRSQTVAAVPMIVEGLRRKGYQIVRLDELLDGLLQAGQPISDRTFPFHK